MIGWLLRLIVRIALRWVVVDLAVRWVARRFGRHRVAAATAELETLAAERLPAPVARAVTALPAEAKNVGGSAVVAARAARTAGTTSRRAVRVAGAASRQVTAVPATARGVAGRVRNEAEASRRRLRAQYLAETVGPEAGTEALLDVRAAPPHHGPGSNGSGTALVDDEEDLHAHVPGPVTTGRRRFRPQPPQLVNRVRRTYRPAPKPWDEPNGRRG